LLGGPLLFFEAVATALVPIRYWVKAWSCCDLRKRFVSLPTTIKDVMAAAEGMTFKRSKRND